MTTTTTYETLEEAIASYPREHVQSDGRHGTCLWHRQHEHFMAHVYPLWPSCDICGGKIDPRSPRHELCRLRNESGSAISRLDDTRECGCAPCTAKRFGQ